MVAALAFLAACGEAPKAGDPALARLLDPDNEPGAMNAGELGERLGPLPVPRKRYRLGVVVKFMGNQYWQLLAEGMQDRAAALGILLDVQGALSEDDRAGQLAIAEAMVAKGYDGLIVSPQTDDNLVPAVTKAMKAGMLVVNVDDAVLVQAEHFVGPNQYENGVRVAEHFLRRRPAGGKVAVIEGQAGVYAAKQRTRGFKDTLAGTGFTVVASRPGNWDLQEALGVASAILAEHPDLVGFYCNNDIMALGVVEAVQKAGRLGEVMVFGTDGIGPAHDSIRAGELTGTIDSFPFATGQIAVEVAVRLLAGQAVPRVVFSPQNLVTLENVDHPMRSAWPSPREAGAGSAP